MPVNGELLLAESPMRAPVDEGELLLAELRLRPLCDAVQVTTNAGRTDVRLNRQHFPKQLRGHLERDQRSPLRL
jgi:hypothetical protein